MPLLWPVTAPFPLMLIVPVVDAALMPQPPVEVRLTLLVIVVVPVVAEVSTTLPLTLPTVPPVSETITLPLPDVDADDGVGRAVERAAGLADVDRAAAALSCVDADRSGGDGPGGVIDVDQPAAATDRPDSSVPPVTLWPTLTMVVPFTARR